MRTLQKERLDQLLVSRGFCNSRERAKRLIMAGKVIVNDQRIDKPGTKISGDAGIRIKGADIPYVSAGGIKLAHALSEFNLNPDNFTAMDIGVSTGGFTDCLLQSGVRKVIAIDVGYSQTAWKIRNHPCVSLFERTNIRHFNNTEFYGICDLICIDVSFISLKLVIPQAVKYLADHGTIISLIKPQFEAGKSKVGKGGIVRKRETHERVITDIVRYCADKDLKLLNITHSPVRGAKGNIEFFIHTGRLQGTSGLVPEDISQVIKQVVEAAHKISGSE